MSRQSISFTKPNDEWLRFVVTARANASGKTVTPETGEPERDGFHQAGLFDQLGHHPVADYIEGLDIHNLTPIQAINALYEAKTKL